MKKLHLFLLVFLFVQWSTISYAAHCPDPKTTSLKDGIPPEPWMENPFSPNHPQSDENTQFIRANILVAGYGQGILCTYKFALGEYSIWWQVRTKIPSRMDNNWIETLGGFVCSQGLETCEFYVSEHK